MSQNQTAIAVVGGGAAGFFAAIHAAERTDRPVVILEQSRKLLNKVKISGGGRCNVTHACYHPSQLVKHYPRGGKKLYKPFKAWATQDTIDWFAQRGVAIKTEADGRMFPTTDEAQTIIDALVQEAQEQGCTIRTRARVEGLQPLEGGYQLTLANGETLQAEQVIVASGGSPNAKGYQWLENLGLPIVQPFPSLFTFNVPDSGLTHLQGLSVQHGWVQLAGTKHCQEGPLLVTHWGFSGPAVIKLSAFAAEYLHEEQYHFPFLINWCGQKPEALQEALDSLMRDHPKKLVQSNQQFGLPQRLWAALCEKAGIDDQTRFAELGKRKRNALMETLARDPYNAKGKSTYKEEFVTAGGVSLNAVNLETFEAKNLPGLYLTGEVLNVDGVTGGFNFQHAWTSGYLAGVAAGAKAAVAEHQPIEQG
jgi:predicted Rossmann fold flavoprotein